MSNHPDQLSKWRCYFRHFFKRVPLKDEDWPDGFPLIGPMEVAYEWCPICKVLR